MDEKIRIKMNATWWMTYQHYVRKIVLDQEKDTKDIGFWRNEIFFGMLSYLTPLSIVALVPGVYMSFFKGVPILGYVDLFAFLSLFIILVCRGIPLIVRKIIFIAIIYLLSLALIYYLGMVGPGLLFLLTLTIISSIIFSASGGYYSAGLNTVICIVFGVFSYNEVHSTPISGFPLGTWIAVTSNLVILSFTCAKCLNLLLGGLTLSLSSNEISEERLKKVNRLYHFISQVNQNIVRVKDEETLFRNSCNLAITFGKFRIAWIGIFDIENKKISLTEQQGLTIQDLELFNNASFLEKSPQYYVLKTGKYYICNDIQNNLEVESWKPFGAKYGINSCIVLPIRKSGKIIGTFNLYSTGLNSTTEEEIELLVGVTDDISFALDLFEKEKKQVITEQLILKNENRFRALIEKSTDMVTLTNIEGNFVYCSPSITKVFGYSVEEFFHKPAFTFFHPDDIPDLIKNRTEIIKIPGRSFSFRYRLLHKNGNWIWCEGTLTNLLHEPAVQALVSNFKDISELIIAEQQKQFDHNNLYALINNTSDLMWSVDRNFNLITSNTAFEEISKLNYGKLIEKGENILLASYSPEMMGNFKSAYERAFSGEIFTEITYYDFPVEFWSEISYYPIRKGNDIIGTACYYRDVTQSKLIERQLRKSEAFNSGVLNSLNSHIAVVNEEGRIVAVNESWKRFAIENGETDLLGVGEGTNYYNVCEASVIAGSGGVSDVLNGIKNVMNGVSETFYFEYPCHSPDQKRWFGMRVLKFETNEPMVVIAHQNISERKLAEENLIQSEARLNEAQEIAQLGSWELDFKNDRHLWSDELYHIFRVKKEAVIPSTELFLSFVHPEDINEIRLKVNEAFKSFKATSYNFRFIRNDGEMRYGYTERKFEFDKNGEPLRLLGVVQDITDRKVIEEEREKMISNIIQHSKNLEQFGYIVSHNLRAPVSSILGISTILKGNLSNEDRIKSQQFLFNAVEHLDEVIKDLNKILQTKSEISKDKEDVNFSDLVDDIKSSIYNLIEKEHVDIQADFSQANSMSTIKSYIQSILYNLISNSIKYKKSDSDPIILIRSKKLNDKIIILFKDNGRGIDMQLHGEKVFGLYKRFHLNVEGKGLGLFMVKTQVEVLGGTINVKSEPGNGTEFIIELPL